MTAASGVLSTLALLFKHGKREDLVDFGGYRNINIRFCRTILTHNALIQNAVKVAFISSRCCVKDTERVELK